MAAVSVSLISASAMSPIPPEYSEDSAHSEPLVSMESKTVAVVSVSLISASVPLSTHPGYSVASAHSEASELPESKMEAAVSVSQALEQEMMVIYIYSKH